MQHKESKMVKDDKNIRWLFFKRGLRDMSVKKF